MMTSQFLLLFMALRVSSYPSYVDCSWKITDSPNVPDLINENIFATSKQIMGQTPKDEQDVIVVKPQVCAGGIATVQLFSSPQTGRGLFHATDGKILSKGLPRDCTNNGNEVMTEFEGGMVGITWEAPETLGTVTFRAMYSRSGFNTPLERGTVNIDVIAYDADNPDCAGPPTSPPTQPAETSIGSECAKYKKNKYIGSGFQFCWTLNSDSTDMMLTHPDATADKWIGLGIGTQMIDSQVVLGYLNGVGEPATSALKPNSKGDKSWQQSINNDYQFSNMKYISANGENVVSFRVPSTTTEVELVTAYGSTSTTNPLQPFDTHGTQRRAVTQNLLTGTTVAKSLSPALIAHATLMVLGWGLLLPAGFLMARYGKKTFPPVEGGSKLGWFEYHKYIQVVGLVLVTIGFIIGLVEGSKTKISHMAIGITVSVLGLWQPLNAKFRPHKKKGKIQEPKRVYWEYLHKGSGYIAILLGFVNIGLGIAIALDQY